jgi:hypothetical protein
VWTSEDIDIILLNIAPMICPLCNIMRYIATSSAQVRSEVNYSTYPCQSKRIGPENSTKKVEVLASAEAHQTSTVGLQGTRSKGVVPQ